MATNDHTESIRSFKLNIREGQELRQKGGFSKAVSVFEETLRLAQENGDQQRQLICLMNLGVLFWNLGQPKKSADFYADALSLAQRLGSENMQDECLGVLKIYEAYSKGKELRSLGRHKESIVHFNIAIELARKINSAEHELKCLRQLSLSYFQLEILKEFFLLNNKAKEIAQKLNHKQEVGRCLNNIGVFYYKSNNYSKALSHFEESLAIAREIKNSKEDESDCLNNIGLIYRDIGDYDRSLKYLMEALDIDLKLKEDNSILTELNNIGAIYRKRGEFSGNINDFQVSLNYHLKSLDKAGKLRNKKLEIDTLNNIGLVYATLGDFVISLKYLNMAQDKAKAINDLHELSNICINTGNAYLRLKDYDESKKSYQLAVDLALKTGSHELLWEAFFGLGQCIEEEKKYEEALSYYKKAVDIIDLIRSQLSLDDFKAGFARDKLKVYESLVHLLFKLKGEESTSRHDEEIFHFVEKAKARAFLESLNEMEDSSQEFCAPAFQKEQDEISRKITLTISGLSEPALVEDQRRILLQRLEKEEEEYISLLNRWKSEKSGKPGFSLLENVSIAKIQDNLLDQNTAIIEFFLGEKQSYVFLITKGHFRLKPLPARAEIENYLKAYLKMLSTWPNGKFQGILAAKRLYRDFIFSFEEILSPGINHLIIVPDGILYYLPFETIARDSEGMNPKQQYLIELYKISYAPSASSLVFLVNKKTEKKNTKRLLAIGNPDYSLTSLQPRKMNKTYGEALREIYLNSGFEFSSLPYTKSEVLQISRYFPRDEVDILLNAEAREEVIKKASLKDYQIIHFACHGFQDEKSPLRSALVLSLNRDTEEDGFLQVREIYNLRLNADLVVLSSCQTGRGKLENGEGTLGLPRVFFYAGAKSTISTLWKINDKSTSELMRSFYRCLAEGNDKAQALQSAKIKMIKSKFSHPFFWAGFVLNGNYSPSSSAQ